MKKNLLLLIAAILVIITSVSAQNLVVNGDFETGDRTGWNAWNNQIITSDVYEGNYSGEIKNWKKGSFTQVITVVAGHSYDVSFTAKWPNGTGWAEGMSMVLKNNDDGVVIARTDIASSTDWTTISKRITVAPGVTNMKIELFKPNVPLCRLDSISVIDAGVINPAIGLSYDGDITEGSEDGEIITVTILNDIWAATLTPANWTFSGIPEGVSIGSVTRVNDTIAEITLTGNASIDYDNSLELHLTIAATEFVTYADDVTSDMFVKFTAIVEPPPVITLVSDGEILEDFEDGEVISVQMEMDTFVDSLDPANWTPLNFPEGVTIASLERVNDTAVNVTLAGNTTGDYDVDIIGGFTIAGDEFTVWQDPVEVSGITFQATVEGGEVVLWEENFDSYAEGTDLTDTIGGNDYGFIWQLIDSAMVHGGVLEVHPTHASAWHADSVNHYFKTCFSPLEVGKTYILYADSKSSDGSTNKLIAELGGEGGHFETEPSGSTEWRTRSLVVEPSLPEHDTALVGIYKWGWNVENLVIYIDNIKLVVLTEPKLSASDDGAILEGEEDGEIISVVLQNDTFATPLNIANWTVTNLPAGVSIGSITRVDDTHAEITLAGNASEDYDVDIIVSVTASRDELKISNKSLTDSSGVTLTAVVEPPTITMSDDGEIKEGAEDLEVITVVLANDTFVVTLTPANWTLTGQPAGVSIGEVFRVDDNTVEITLSGNATEDYDTNITDATLTVKAAELKLCESDISTNTGVTFIASNETDVQNMKIDGLEVYPNPVTSRLYITAHSTISDVEVYGILGEKIMVLNGLNSKKVIINTEQWNAGVYFIRVTDIDGNRSLSKVIK